MKNNNLNLKEEVKVSEGIWMPNANILCYECHGNVFKKVKYNPDTNKCEDVVLSEEEFKEAKSEKSLKKDYAITKCNCCNKDIQVRDEIAYENNLVRDLKDFGINAYMSQTGGMNSACEVPTKDGGFMWVTYDIVGEGEWLIGFYDEEGAFTENGIFETTDRDELLEHILELKKDDII